MTLSFKTLKKWASAGVVRGKACHMSVQETGDGRWQS